MTELFGKRIDRVLQFKNARREQVSVNHYRPGQVGDMLVTSGMHKQQMNIPEGAPINSRIELIVYLNHFDPKYAKRLKLNSDFPFIDKTCLSHGDTVNWGFSTHEDDDRTVDLFIYSTYREHQSIEISSSGDRADLLVLLPIYAEELEFKRDQGLGELLRAFDEHSVPLQADAERKSIC